MHRNNAPQLCFDLFNHGGCASGDNCDAAQVALMVHFGNGQAIDVVTTA